MQEAAFAKAGLQAFYSVFELPPNEFRKTIRNLRRSSLDGFNVTVPHKVAALAALAHLHHVSPEAQAIGAVNTVYRKG